MIGIGLELRLEPRLKLRLVPNTKPLRIKNPLISKNAIDRLSEFPDRNMSISDIRNTEGRIDKELVEAYLLSKWSRRNAWDMFLDAPLIVHADAAILLSNYYDAVVGIQTAGTAYSEIFRLMGFSEAKVDYSHYKKKMSAPQEMDKDQVEMLRVKRHVLLVDIDFVTGETVRKVYTYLTNLGINVEGIYFGISVMPANPELLKWNKGHSLVVLQSSEPYAKGLIPRKLEIYAPNSSIENNEQTANWIAMRVAEYLIKKRERSELQE